jgi:hypothetical protein
LHDLDYKEHLISLEDFLSHVKALSATPKAVIGTRNGVERNSLENIRMVTPLLIVLRFSTCA